MAALTHAAVIRRGERGQILMITTVMGLLAMAMWMLAWRSTHDAIRLERLTVQRERRAGTVERALAAGLSLLETGRPPLDPYSCISSVTFGESSFDCAVIYESQGSQDDWSVQARFATESEALNLPPMPSTF